MPVTIIPVEDKSTLRDFINLPKELYRKASGYVPHLDIERLETFSSLRNPYFRHATGTLFVAYLNNKPVGRISAQICDLYQKKHGLGIGHFGFLDCIEDNDILSALLRRAEGWLINRGIVINQGPFHFSSNEESGLMIDGFSSRPMVMMPYHPPYLSLMLERQGYKKAKDLIAYDLPISAYRPMGKGRFMERAVKEARITIRAIQMNNLKNDLKLMLDIFNDAWAENWGMIPFTPEEAEAAVKALKPLVYPPLFRIAEIDNIPIAMIICLPNLNEAIRDLNGKLLPLGWLKLLWRLKMRKIKSARIPLMGIRRAFHGTPAASATLALMFDSLVPPAKNWGFENIELSWILEDNVPMRRVIESIGGVAYKTYRIFEKRLVT